MPNPLHHIHQRKTTSDSVSPPYPHPQKKKRILDIIIYPIGVLGPLITVPQAFKIWTEKTAEGVSITSWLGLFCIAIAWIIYGVAHKDKPITLTNIGFAAVQFFIVLGIIMYG